MATAARPKPAEAALKIATAHPPRLQTLPAGALLSPPEYARPVRPKWAEYLAKTWVDKKAGVLTVSRRADGCYYAITGNHRAAAKVLAGDADYRFDCQVFYGLTLEEEAMIYLAQDSERLRHTVADDFQAMIARGNETAIGVDRVIKALDLTVSPYAGAGWAPNRIRAVGALLQAFDTSGAQNLYDALALIREKWGHLQIKLGGRTKKTIYSEAVVVSLPAFLRLYPDADRDWLSHAMEREGLKGFEERWVGHRTASITRPQGGIAIIYGVLAWVDMYNHGRREKNLLDEMVARRASKMLRRRSRRGLE